MQYNFVSWNPCTRSQLISYSQNRLRLLEFCDEQSNSTRDLREIRAWDAPQVQCLGWRGSVDQPPVVAYGTAAGYVHLVNLSSGEEVSVSQGVRLGKRQCNAVSWNRHMPSQLLAGFDSLKSEFCAVVWDFEHEHLLQTSFGESACSLSWLPDNAHSLAVGTSMGWVKVYDTRASSQVGAACSILAHPAPRPRKIRGIRSDPIRPYLFATYSDYPGDVVKIWDLRKVANPTSKAVVPPSFIVVPSSGSPSPAQPNSFSSQFANSIGGDAEAVVDVQWSTARAGVLAVATSHRRSVSFYSTSTVSGTSHVPIYSVGVPAPVQLNGLSWQAGVDTIPPIAAMDMTALHSAAAGQNSPLQADRKSIVASMSAPAAGAGAASQAVGWENFRADEELRNCDYPAILRGLHAQHAHHSAPAPGPRGHPRLLVATVQEGDAVLTGGFAEVEVLDRIPLAVSAAGGLLAVNTVRGRQVALSCGSINRIPCLQFDGAQKAGREESPADCYRYTDVGEHMCRRCRAGYSADAYANIDVLAEELDAVYANAAALMGPAEQVLRPAVANTKAVYRTWVWMDRFESTVNEAGLTVANCGALDILVRNQMHQSTGNLRNANQRRSSRHPTLGATVHTSDSRDLAKKLCGWIQMFGLSKGATPPADAGSGTFSRSSSGSVMNKPPTPGSRGAAEHVESETGADDDLLDVIVDELFLDSFERAAAIALWHGRIDLAVSILRRAIAQMEDLGVKQPSSPTRHEAKARTRSGDLTTEEGAAYHQKVLWDAPYAPGYLQTISLVAMCFAGFHCPAPEVRPGSPNKGGQSPPPLSSASAGMSSAASTWASMCKHVVAQLALSKREATGYLVAACHFLLANIGDTDDRNFSSSSSGGPTPTGIYYPVVADARLTMEDRVAFACTYLSDDEVVAWLERTVEHCAADGNIEGVLITGLSPAGLGVLQKYVDRYDDVQTVALLVSRVLDSPQAVVGSAAAGTGAPASTPTREWIWLHEYRNLLNKWEMFIERAYLDVELGKRYRRKAAMLSALAAPAAGKDRNSLANKRTPKGIAPQSQQSKSKAGRVLYRLPVHSDYPHFFLRCGFCGASLPVDGMQNIRPEHLRVQSNILNCCAACSKQLPRCYVCQLYMGMVNPYLELNRVMTQKRLSADKLLQTPTPAGVGTGTGPGTASGGSARQSSSHADGDEASMHSGISGSWNHAQDAGAEGKDHNVVSFGKWFFFCQHCRHGGHANCVDQWFGGTGNVTAERKPVLCSVIGAKEEAEVPVKRMVCGVNGCDCRCVARL